MPFELCLTPKSFLKKGEQSWGHLEREKAKNLRFYSQE